MPERQTTYDNTLPLLLAPNGQPSNLTPELYAYVRTPEFKQWFGDWQKDPKNASRILDENGEPLVLYRGQWNHANVPFVNHGDGIYFTPDRHAAIGYGMDHDPIPVFLNARNTYEVDFDGDADTEQTNYHADIRGEYHYAREEDFDILIATNTFDGENDLDQYVVHDNAQIQRIDTLNPKEIIANVLKEDLNDNGISVDNDILRKYYGLSHLVLSQNKDVVTLNKIVVAQQNEGKGSQFMRDLVDLADNNGWTLALTPDTSLGATSKNRLKNFYQQFDFQNNKGEIADYSIKESMIRNPQSINQDISFHMQNNITSPQRPKTFGAPYQGSKNKIADKIISTLPKGKRFVDLFSGGGAVTHAALMSGRFKSVHMNDLYPAGQQLFIQGTKGEWHNKTLKPISEEQFKEIIGTPEAIVRSVRAKGKTLTKPNNGRDRTQEQLRRVKRLEQLRPYESKLHSSELDYSMVKLNKDDVVYCDIPYENTRQDGYTGKFDKQKFLDWAQNQKMPVYVSEYNMPEGWTEIATFNVAENQIKDKQEKLFVQDKFAEQYFAAKEEEYKEHLTNKTTNMQFQFIGETGALQLDKATQSLSILLNLATAKEMADADKDPLTIKMATGWEKGIDNKWRYEIPDQIMPVSSLSLLQDGMTDGTTATLNDIFTKAPFLDAYPQLANMPVVVDKERAAGASFNPETRQITISANELRIFDNSDDLNAEEVSATIIHEIQHAIQYIEGFAQGGNIQTVANQQRKEAEAQMNALSDIYSQYQMIDFRTLSNDTQEALQAFKERDEFEAAHETELMTYLMARTQLEMAELDMVAGRLQKNNFDNYQKIAGEVEARNAARRTYMTPEERRNSLAAATEDIVRDQQIVILNNIRPLLGENTSPLLHNDIVLRDRLIQLMQVAGIAVNTNWQEGQNVLNMANNQAKLQQSQTRDSYLKAPNGEKTNLQNDQWAQVRTDEFKNWYGDWQNDPQNASKLIGQNGEPMVLYHGTNVEFNTFEQHEGLRWHGWGEQFTANAKGFFFSDNFDDAKKHAHSNAFMKGGEEIVMPVYVSMKNPADLSGDGKNDIEELFHDLTGYYPLEHPDYHRRDQWWRIVEDEEFDIPAKLKELGYDGIIFAEKVSEYTDVTEEKSYYVTNPNQIKSATINNGEFSLNNNDIRFQLADSSSLSLPTQQPIFISNALLALQQIQQQKATPQQWLGMLKNLNGIKPGEDRWTGLSDWLANNTEKTLTKQQVLDYIAQNQIVVEETHYENLEDIPRFKELYKEYLDEIKNVNDLYWEAKQNYDDFYNRMVEKYGQDFDIESDLTEEEREEEEELFNEKDGYDTYEVSAEEQAFKLMVDKYGEKFEWAFSHDGDMLIIENDEDAGIFLYDDKVKQINDTRLCYTTQELDNKHEIALTVPTIESWNENDEIHFGDAGGGRAVAWVRFGETTDADGNRVLVIDEIQSKRHQEGRERGYRSQEEKEWRNRYKEIEQEQRGLFPNDILTETDRIRYLYSNEGEGIRSRYYELEEERRNLLKKIDASTRSVPDAPFEKNWHELAMKRMLRYAAENGYDRVAWTTGDQQAERYNIGNVINEIVVGEKRSADDLNYHFGDDKIQQDAKLVTLMVKNSDNTLSLAVNDDGKIIYCHETEEMDNKNLDQMVGKKLAEEVLKADNQTFSVDDIKVGMEGMIAFYDQMLPNFINKYTKKWNTHTEDVQIPNIEDYGIKTTLHSIPVTPQMKDDVMQGQPMFFLTPQGNAYGYTFNNTIYIDPRIATSETPIHEYAHLWAQAMRQYNAEEWQNIVSLMKQVKPVWDMVQRQYSHLASDSDIAEEVLAQYTGKQGMKRLERALKNYDNDISDQQAENIIERIKAAIDRFWQKTADFLHIHYESADQVASRVFHDMMNQVNPQRLAQQLTQEKNQQKPALAQQPVIRTYSTAPYLDVQTLAHGVKDGDKESIKEAAKRMAETINVIPDKNNLVLVPMPSHDGYATYTKTLSEEIAKLTGLPTKDVLTVQPHASLYDFKLANGIQNLPMPSVSLTNDFPEGKIPLIIDNVLDTGTTAYAATQAFGPDTNARVAVLGNTDNFYHFHNGIVLESEKLLDIRYLNAVERGDLETAQQMVNAQAQKMGYSFEDIERDAHVAPGATLDTKDLRDLNLHAQNIENGEDVNLFAVANGISPQPDDYFTHSMAPKWYMYNDQSGMESQSAILSAIRNIQYQTKHDGEVKEMPKVTVFRAVPKEVREDHIRRNGEWVSPSLSYAINHGEHRLGIDNYRIIKEAIPADQLWWDGNDIREWGVDDGRSYAFRNTPNNAKLLDPVTYDNQGNVIPLSQRFNAQNPEFRFQLAGQRGAAKLDAIDHKGRIENLHVAQEMEKTNHTPKEIKISTGWERGADNKWRYEIPDAFLNPNASITKYADLKTEFARLIDVAYNEKNMASQQRTYRQADRIRNKYLMMPFNEKTIGELVSADADIFKAYPEIANIKLKIEQDVLMTLKGYYNEKNNTIMLNLSHLKSQDDIRSTLLHEIQHFIQAKEGFAQGANVDQQIPDVVIRDVKNNIEELQRGIEDKQKTLNEIHEQLPEMRQLLDQVKVAFKTHGVGSPEIIKAMQDVNEFKSLHKEKFNLAQQLNIEIDDDNKKIESLHKYLKDNVLGYDEYTKMAGEVEARNVQSRMLRNPDINARTTTESTEDVPRSQQTVIFNNGTTSQQTDAPSVAPSQQQNLSPTTQQTAKQQSDKPSKPFNMPNQTPRYDYIQEFLDTKSKLQAAKADQNLSKMVRFEMPDGSKQVMTNAAYIQYALKHNLTVAATPEKGNIPDSKVQQINRAFNSANENIVKRDLGKYYKPTPEMMAYEKILNRRFSSRGDERPSNQEMGQARQKAIESIIDANTPTTMYYHVKIDNAGASMPISKTMYDYANFIQQHTVDELTKQLTDMLSEPKFKDWLDKNEEGDIYISDTEILRVKDNQLQLGHYYMPEGTQQPEFITEDMATKDFHQQIGNLLYAIKNANYLHIDMQVETLMGQLNTDRITLDEPMTVKLKNDDTVSITAVAQDEPGKFTYLISDQGTPLTPLYVNSADFDKVVDKAIEDANQQLAESVVRDAITQIGNRDSIGGDERSITLKNGQVFNLQLIQYDKDLNKFLITDFNNGKVEDMSLAQPADILAYVNDHLQWIKNDKENQVMVGQIKDFLHQNSSLDMNGLMGIKDIHINPPSNSINVPGGTDNLYVTKAEDNSVAPLRQTIPPQDLSSFLQNSIHMINQITTEQQQNKAMADARKHIENAFPDSFISLSDPLKHDDTLSVIIDGKDTHIFPVSLPEDFKEDHNFGFVVQMPSDDNMAFMAVETAINNVDEMEVINEKSVLFYDINDAIEFKQQANLLTELHKLNELEKKAKMELPFANPQWQQENDKQIEGAKLMLYGNDSGIRAEYLQNTSYDGQKSELGFAVGKYINAANIGSLTEIYAKQHPEHQMFNNGVDDLTVKFSDVREALQFQAFVNKLVNTEPKLTEEQTQNMANIRERYPDTIILNRNEHNYESYGKDAERLSSLLELPINYDRGFAVSKIDTREIDVALIEIISKNHHATVVDDKELSIRTQAKIMNEISSQLIETMGEGHHSLIGHPPTEQLPGFHLATKNKLGYMNITSLDLSVDKVPTVSLNSENNKSSISLLLLPLDQQQNLLAYAKALNAYQALQNSIDDQITQTTNDNQQNISLESSIQTLKDLLTVNAKPEDWPSIDIPGNKALQLVNIDNNPYIDVIYDRNPIENIALEDHSPQEQMDLVNKGIETIVDSYKAQLKEMMTLMENHNRLDTYWEDTIYNTLEADLTGHSPIEHVHAIINLKSELVNDEINSLAEMMQQTGVTKVELDDKFLSVDKESNRPVLEDKMASNSQSFESRSPYFQLMDIMQAMDKIQESAELQKQSQTHQTEQATGQKSGVNISTDKSDNIEQSQHNQTDMAKNNETEKLSPMLRQFYDLKEKHPDAMLLFRCGDFYETYMQDAQKASFILGITLTRSNNKKGPDGKPFEMAGFPHHALDTYLPKLIRAGMRVAICDQLEDPRLSKNKTKQQDIFSKPQQTTSDNVQTVAGSQQQNKADQQTTQADVQSADVSQQQQQSPQTANVQAPNHPNATLQTEQQPDNSHTAQPNSDDDKQLTEDEIRKWAEEEGLPITFDPLKNIRQDFNESGLLALPVDFEHDDRRFMDIDGMVRKPYLDFSEDNSHKPETMIAPMSVEYSKADDSLLLHGKNINGDYVTIPLQNSENLNNNQIRVYEIIAQQLEHPMWQAKQHAYMAHYAAEESIANGKPSQVFINKTENSELVAYNGNRISVGKYNPDTKQFAVSEKNELGHMVNDTSIDAMQMARMIANKEITAIMKQHLVDPTLSYPSLETVRAKNTELADSPISKLYAKFNNTVFSHDEEKALIVGVTLQSKDQINPSGVELSAISISGANFHILPDSPDNNFKQTGNKIDGIIQEIEKRGFIDREKNMPYNLMDPISYSRNNRISGPEQTSSDNLMVDFGPNHFYFQQTLSGKEAGKYYASYEIENLDHSTKIKVVDMDIDKAEVIMRREMSDYDLRNNQSHSLNETENLVKDIIKDNVLQMVDLKKQIHNIPTGDKEMADDPRYPVMDVSMVKIDSQGEIILHGPGGPAPLASLDETARFEVMRRTINDMMEQNLDLPVKLDRVFDKYQGFGKDIIKPFMEPKNLKDNEDGIQRIGAAVISENRQLTFFHDIKDAVQFVDFPNSKQNNNLSKMQITDLPVSSQRELLDGMLNFYKSPNLQRAAEREINEAEDLLLGPHQNVSPTNNKTEKNEMVTPLFDNPMVLPNNIGEYQKVIAVTINGQPGEMTDKNPQINTQPTIMLFENIKEAVDYANGGKAQPLRLESFTNEAQREILMGVVDKIGSQILSFSNNMSNFNSEEKTMKPDEQKTQVEQQKADPEVKNQEKAMAREAAAAAVLAAIGTGTTKLKMADDQHISLDTNKGATIEVQTVSVTKNNTLSVYGEMDGTKKSISANQLTDDALNKLAAHVQNVTQGQNVNNEAAVTKPVEQKAAPEQKIETPAQQTTNEQKTDAKQAQTQQTEQKADQPRERKLEPIELKPDSKVEFNVSKNPVLDKVYDIQIYVDGEKKGGHHLSLEDRKDFFDKKVTGPELLAKYFDKELAGQKLPDNIERHHFERKQDAPEQKTDTKQAQTQQTEQKTDQPRERKMEPIELKPDAKVEFNVSKNPVLDKVYDIQIYVDGEKKGGHHLSLEDRKDFFDKKVTGPELLAKYFDKELAGQKLPDNIERHHFERKQDAPEQKADTKQAQTQQTEQKAEQPREQKQPAVKPDEVIAAWKKASEPEKVTFIQRDSDKGKFYQTFGADAAKTAELLQRTAKGVTNGPNSDLAYISVNQKDMPNLMKSLKEQGDQIKVVDLNGKYARVLPEPQTKKADDYSKYQMPENKKVENLKVWAKEGTVYMNAEVNGNKLPMKEISWEDRKAHKEGKATPEQLVAKHYAPAEIEAKREQSQSKGMSR